MNRKSNHLIHMTKQSVVTSDVLVIEEKRVLETKNSALINPDIYKEAPRRRCILEKTVVQRQTGLCQLFRSTQTKNMFFSLAKGNAQIASVN